MPRKGNRCTTMVNFQLTPLEATALQAVVVHLSCWTHPPSFKLGRTDLPEGRVPSPLVVEHLDVIE